MVRIQKELDTRHVPDATVHAKRVASDLREKHEGQDCLSTVARRLREQLREIGVTDYQKLSKNIMRDFKVQVMGWDGMGPSYPIATLLPPHRCDSLPPGPGDLTNNPPLPPPLCGLTLIH